MKEKLIIPFTMIMAFSFFVGIGQAQPKFSFKVTGGYGTILTGDFNKVISSFYTQLLNLAGAFLSSKEGEFEKIPMGIDYEGEFILNLTKNIGIGIGVGYIQRSIASEARLKLGSLFGNYKLEPKGTAISAKLSAYYLYPVGTRINIFVNGGIDYYFERITYYSKVEINSSELIFYKKYEGSAKDNGIGYHGGIGFEYNVAKNIGIYIEGAGRYVKLRDWHGDYTLTYSKEIINKTSGTFWYYEELDESTGEYYSNFTISKEKPTFKSKEQNYRNIRKAEITLSGFSIKIGIRIKI